MAGDSNNAAKFFIARFYEDLKSSLDGLIFLAAHVITTGARLHPLGVGGGLDIAICKDGIVEPVPEPQIQELEQHSRETDREISKIPAPTEDKEPIQDRAGKPRYNAQPTKSTRKFHRFHCIILAVNKPARPSIPQITVSEPNAFNATKPLNKHARMPATVTIRPKIFKFKTLRNKSALDCCR